MQRAAPADISAFPRGYAGTWVVKLKTHNESYAVAVHILFKLGEHDLKLTDVHHAVNSNYPAYATNDYPQVLAITQEQYVEGHHRLEVSGTTQVKVWATTPEKVRRVRLTFFSGDDGAPAASIAVTLVGCVRADPEFTAAVQQYVAAYWTAARSKKFTRRLSDWQRDNVGRICALMHWYETCATGVVQGTANGIKDIGTLVGSHAALDAWWSSSVETVRQWVRLPTAAEVAAGKRQRYLEVVGVAALSVAVGPYTDVPDRRDTRNHQWDSFFTRGDCDKNAISGAALYTVLRKMTPDDVAALTSELARDVVAVFKASFGQAIVLHIKTDLDTAHGRPAQLTESKWVGHCVMMIAPRGWNPETNDPLTGALFGEMTRATAPTEASNIFAKSSSEPGQGEVVPLKPATYPMIAQFLTQDGCYVFKSKSGGGMPTLADVLAGRSTYVRYAQAPAIEPLADMITTAMCNVDQLFWPCGPRVTPVPAGIRLANVHSSNFPLYQKSQEAQYIKLGPVIWGCVGGTGVAAGTGPAGAGVDHAVLRTNIVGM